MAGVDNFMVKDLLLSSTFGGSVFVGLFLAADEGTDGLRLKDSGGKVWVVPLGLLNLFSGLGFYFRTWVFIFIFSVLTYDGPMALPLKELPQVSK